MRPTRRTAILAAILVIGCLSVVATAQPSQPQTRLVHGPVILRLTGYEQADPGTGRDEWRYLVLFKLNRIVERRPRGGGDGHTASGDFSVLDVPFDYQTSPHEFGRSGCLALIMYGPGSVSPGGDLKAELLDNKRLGSKVKVKLRPLTRGSDGKPKPGKTYVAYPRLQRADVLLRGVTARRELKRIGCKNRPLP